MSEQFIGGILTGLVLAASFIAVYQMAINRGYMIAIRMLRNSRAKDFLEANKDIVSNVSYMQRRG